MTTEQCKWNLYMLFESYQTLILFQMYGMSSCLSSEAKWVICLALEVGIITSAQVYNCIVGLKLVPKEINNQKKIKGYRVSVGSMFSKVPEAFFPWIALVGFFWTLHGMCRKISYKSAVMAAQIQPACNVQEKFSCTHPSGNLTPTPTWWIPEQTLFASTSSYSRCVQRLPV